MPDDRTLAEVMKDEEQPRRQSWFETFKRWGYFEEEADAERSRLIRR